MTSLEISALHAFGMDFPNSYIFKANGQPQPPVMPPCLMPNVKKEKKVVVNESMATLPLATDPFEKSYWLSIMEQYSEVTLHSLEGIGSSH